MFFSFGKNCAIYIDASYAEKWGNMGLSEVTESADQSTYDKAAAKLSLFRVSDLEAKNCMNGGADHCYSPVQFLDKKLGVLIQKNGESDFSIFSTQECPEWFTLMTEIVLLLSDQTLIHAAALEKDGKALLLPARGGVGKTATVVQMIRKHGWKLLGDDLVILNGEGVVRSYFKKITIYGWHQNLYPELFEKHKGPVKSSHLNYVIKNMIPTAKKVLRLFPPAFNYIRKHNPQHILISPYDLFKPEELSPVANKIQYTMWLERVEDNDTIVSAASTEDVASRAAAATLNELTYGTMNLNYCLTTMCSCGMLDYNMLYGRLYGIIFYSIQNSSKYLLKIPQSYRVETVADCVCERICGIEHEKM